MKALFVLIVCAFVVINISASPLFRGFGGYRGGYGGGGSYGGSSSGQGFVGNGGIGIVQSGATLGNTMGIAAGGYGGRGGFW